MSKKCTVIDNDTGEIINENFNIDEIEDVKRKKEGIRRSKEFEEFKTIQSAYMGNFIFFLYKSVNELEEILSDNDLVRYIYLGTFTKSNGYLILDNNKTYITKKEMQNLLKMGDTAFKKFFNNIISNNLLTEINDKYRINIYYFWRGKEINYKSITGNKLENYTRIYINATRELYKSNYKRPKKLAMAYKLIPYINWKYNVLCNNIKETCKEKIDILHIENIINIVGYNKKNIGRFKYYFYGIKFYGYSLFMTLQDQPEYKSSIILVNPLFAYRNRVVNDLKYLFVLFDICKDI